MARGWTLALGDVDADTPAETVERLLPLGGYLERRLNDSLLAGSSSEPAPVSGSVSVVVTKTPLEMARRLRAAEVDIYIDSLFPSLTVLALEVAEPVLSSWVRSSGSYYGVFLVLEDSTLDSLASLEGRVVAFEEPHSTSGFFLPARRLLNLGLGLRQVEVGDEAGRNVGYLFSGEAENSIEMLLAGRVAAAVISNEDYEDLPTSLRSRFRLVDRTESAPRRVASVRKGLDPDLRRALIQALLELAPDEPVVLETGPEAWSWKFDELTDEDRAALAEMAPAIDDLTSIRRRSDAG